MSTENAYGFSKRLQFVSSIIEETNPRTVLDFGCGTGNNLVAPLAARFPSIAFLGVDSDPPSIEFARGHHQYPNLEFAVTTALDARAQFDLVIASEVLEHVIEPHDLLRFLRERLSAGGQLVLTVPNGYGPFELASLVEAGLRATGVLSVLFRMAAWARGESRRPKAAAESDTLAHSPNVNFFSYGELRRVIDAAGLNVTTYRPRTWLCGFGFDSVIRRPALTVWNANIAECLWPCLVSGWMFVLRKGADAPARHDQYRRNIYARFRKWVNLGRGGLTSC